MHWSTQRIRVRLRVLVIATCPFIRKSVTHTCNINNRQLIGSVTFIFGETNINK